MWYPIKETVPSLSINEYYLRILLLRVLSLKQVRASHVRECDYQNVIALVELNTSSCSVTYVLNKCVARCKMAWTNDGF